MLSKDATGDTKTRSSIDFQGRNSFFFLLITKSKINSPISHKVNVPLGVDNDA